MLDDLLSKETQKFFWDFEWSGPSQKEAFELIDIRYVIVQIYGVTHKYKEKQFCWNLVHHKGIFIQSEVGGDHWLQVIQGDSKILLRLWVIRSKSERSFWANR